jgi:hypothetical protein
MVIQLVPDLHRLRGKTAISTTNRPMVCFYLHVPSWVAGSMPYAGAAYAPEFTRERR